MKSTEARRHRSLWIVALACVVLICGIVVLSIVRHRSPGTFTLHDVRAYEMSLARPRSVYGDVQVEAAFDYTGPPVTGGQAGSVTRFLRHFKLIKPAVMVWRNEDATLTDPAGHEVQRYSTSPLPAAGATTRPVARVGLMEDAAQHKVHVLFNFDVPPADRTKPLTFRTRFGLNQFAPVDIEVTLPAVPSTQPATSPVSSPP